MWMENIDLHASLLSCEQREAGVSTCIIQHLMAGKVCCVRNIIRN